MGDVAARNSGEFQLESHEFCRAAEMIRCEWQSCEIEVGTAESRSGSYFFVTQTGRRTLPAQTGRMSTLSWAVCSMRESSGTGSRLVMPALTVSECANGFSSLLEAALATSAGVLRQSIRCRK